MEPVVHRIPHAPAETFKNELRVLLGCNCTKSHFGRKYWSCGQTKKPITPPPFTELWYGMPIGCLASKPWVELRT